MDEQRKIRLLELLLNLAKGFKIQDVIFVVPPDFGRHASSEFKNETRIAYYNLVKELLESDGWSEKYSEKYIKDQLVGCIRAIRNSSFDRETAIEVLEKLVSDYESYDVQRTVLLPLDGIGLASSELELGRITLCSLSSEEVETFRTTLKDRMTAQLTDEQKQQPNPTLNMMDPHVAKLTGRICAKFKVVAEPQRAKELAIEETRRIIDILLFANGAIHSRELKTRIGLLGEVATDICPVLYDETSDGTFTVSFDRKGVIASLNIDDQALAMMEHIGVFVLSDLLKRNSSGLTKFEHLLLRSTHWFANAQTQEDKDNELLNLMTALEIFFTPAAGSPIADSIALGTAFTLSDDFKTRKEIRDRVRSLYKSRSSISHAGRKSATESDLIFFRDVVFGVIQLMIKRRQEFKSLDDIRNWVEDQKIK